MYQIIFFSQDKNENSLLCGHNYLDISVGERRSLCVLTGQHFFLVVHYSPPWFSEQCTSFPWEQHSMNYQSSCKFRDNTVVESGTKNTKTSPLYLKQSMNERRKNTSRSKRVLWSSRRGSQKNKHGIKNMTRAYETNRKKLFQLIKK